MPGLTHAQRTLLRQLSQGRSPSADLRNGVTSWRFGDVSVTREMNQLRKRGLVRCWSDGERAQHLEITDEGYAVLGHSRAAFASGRGAAA